MTVTNDIAVVGLACRFPGASCADEFWSNLASGVSSVREIPQERWSHEAYAGQTSCKWGGFLEGIAEFDARFFAISPREARKMDPQGRLLLEVAWHCTENSGIAPAQLRQRRTGVYAGVMALDYLQTATEPGVEVDGLSCLGGYSCILSNRISHALGLSGPSMTIDTACSSSLVAIHLARQALLSGDCDFAFVSGVCLNHKPWKHLSFSRARMLSPTGRCRTFDAAADGYVPGEGCGVLLLQPLQQALADGNRVLGIVRGSAVNHSAVEESITAPSVERQAALLASAYRNAAVDPSTVTYVEAHGTGTSLGDPIEMEALTRAFQPHSQRNGYCGVGSVKTNIGHLEAAAGIAGVIKVLLMMREKTIPPTLNLGTPNPLIDFATSPFVPVLETAPWKPASEGLPLRAGVSSFGFGGSNAHIILEAPENDGFVGPETPREPAHEMPFLLSAKSSRSLERLVAAWRTSTAQFSSRLDLSEVCANLALSRESFSWRFGCAVSNWADVAEALERFEPAQAMAAAEAGAPRKVPPRRDALERMVAGIALTDAEFESVVEQARTLWRRQVTFTRFVEAWQAPLRHMGIELEDLLGGESLEESKRTLVFVAIRSSLRRLCSNWKLTDRAPSGSAPLDEFVQICADGNLEPAEALGWLSGNAPGAVPGQVAPAEPAPTAANLPADAVAQWLTGNEVDWRPFFPRPYRKLSLPLYPFDRQAYWLHPEGESPSTESKSHSRGIDPDDPIVNAHFLNGRRILPAAHMLWFALESARLATGRAVRTLSDFTIHRPVLMPVEESRQVRSIEASVDSTGGLQLSVEGNVAGTVTLSDDDPAFTGTPPLPQQPRPYELATPQIYAALRARGYQYGRALQVIQSVSASDDVAEFAIESGDRTALLDGILQAAVSLRTLWGDGGAGPFEVPTRIQTFFAGDLNGHCKVRVERQNCSFLASGSRIALDAVDGAGRVVAAVRGLELSAAPRLGPEICYFAPSWTAAPLRAAASNGRSPLSLIFAASAPFGFTLFQQLRPGRECRLILTGRGFESLGGGMFQMDFTDPENYRRLLESIAPMVDTQTGVSVYWIADEPDARQSQLANARQMVAHGVRGVFLLTQSWATLLRSIPLRLTVVTVDSQAVTEADRVTGFASSGTEALGRTASIEMPGVRFQSIDLEAATPMEERSRLVLAEMAAPFEEDTVAYRGGLRHVRKIGVPGEQAAGETFIPAGACILITGGNGALAAEAARAIASHAEVRLILLGRSPANAGTERLLSEIAALGSVAEYEQGDVTDAGSLDALFSRWSGIGLRLHGVIHAAGLIEDALLPNQNAAAFDRVVAPKLMGALLLAERLREHPVNFFLAYSSIVPLTGNAGQANYAVANALLDAFCAHRSRNLPARSISINWGPWESMGMGSAAKVSARFRARGIEPLSAGPGRHALVDLLTRPFPMQVAVAGKQTANEAFAGPGCDLPPTSPAPSVRVQGGGGSERELITLIARTLQTDPANLSRDEGFFSIGIESVMIEEIMAELGKRYAGLRPTLLFDYPNIAALAGYLDSRATDGGSGVAVADETGKLKTEADNPKTMEPAAPSARSAPGYEIAIVGIDGRYPKSPDLDAFWSNLCSGNSCVEEIPASRWDHAPYFSETRRPNRTHGKWGGFLEGVDLFDPYFFNISPKEAEQTDPQQRLFLESAWHTMEHAGYGSRESRRGQRIGLFVGVMWHDYSHVARDLSANWDENGGPGGLFWAIANRVSHFLDLTGPSLAIDSACSSSLTAIHLACQSILAGDCEMALAGGVNLCLHPFRYLYLSQAGFLSKDGLCRSFGQGGDGYVPGEGVGAVLLKPLARALADGDTVHGVVRGSSINHGGRASGFTVPNAAAQGELIEKSLQRAGLRLGDLQYIECHGTGTSLGDPIEIGALAEVALRDGYSGDRIPIGSVKSNIGHLEAAAGMAGLTKVLQAMRHGLIPATLHCQPANAKIPFSETPFEVAAQNSPWEPGQRPRLAAVSSFGAGGSNAHVILEDWKHAVAAPPDRGRWIIVLSARTKDRLAPMAVALRGFLAAHRPSLDDVSWTLQAGREAMQERLAIVTSCLEELTDQLDAFANGTVRRGCFSARASNLPGSNSVGLSDARMTDDEIAERWTTGAAIDWTSRRAIGARRIPLPVYPYARERYWLTPAKPSLPGEASRTGRAAPKENSLRGGRLLGRIWVDEPGREEAHGQRPLRVGVLTGDAPCEEVVDRLPQGLRVEYVPLREAGLPVEPAILAVLDAFIDLVDFGRAPSLNPRPEATRLAAYQSLLDSVGQRPVRLLHVTRGLRSHKSGTANLNLEGAWIANLFPVLSSEHRSVRARTVDFEDGMAASEVAAALARELCLDSASAEVRYAHGKRAAAAWESLPMPNAKWQLDAGKVYLVTGGTSGLGAEIAAWLAAKGARKLLLLGVTPLPPKETWPGLANGHSDAIQKRIRPIMDLEKSGVKTRLFSGRLTERERLRSFLESSVRQLGPIGGVVHCAGVTPTSTGSFVRKNIDAMLETLEPKVQGLTTLADLVPPRSVDFFHLFSSVSAAVPALGAGLSDYACANGFLNTFAEVYRSRGANVSAINWPSWSGAGSARGESPRYRQLGFKTLQVGEALDLYERLAASPMPAMPAIMLPCTVEPEVFQVERLGIAGPSYSSPIAAPAPSLPPPSPPPSISHSAHGARRWLAEWFSRELKIPPERLDGTTNFAEYGVDSVLIADLAQAIERRAGSPLDPSQLLEHSSIDLLSEYLAAGHGAAFAEPAGLAGLAEIAGLAGPTQLAEPVGYAEPPAPPPPASCPPSRAIAVIGIGCHFPGAANVEQFWANLVQGVDSIREVPPSRWDHSALYGENGNATKLTSRWGGFIDGLEMFDATYFGIQDVEAEQVDPSIRQVLEVFAETVRHAGYDEGELRGKQVGVFAGARAGSYSRRYEKWAKHSIVGAGQNFIACLASHVFDWKGPGLVVDTACSSSLVAVHLACRSLLDGECDMAMAGGVDLLLDEQPYRILSEAKALSPEGRCFTFDLRANGFVAGEGCGAVLLKRLDEALADGDQVYAIIEGSAINNDGRTMGTTTPSLDGQQRVIEAALRRAGVDGGSVSYVEAHGTGTLIGDPIELKALSRVLRTYTEDRAFCAVGSVKTNFGHLLSAAGVAGFIKTALAAWHGTIPPTLHCEQPNPRFDFANSPLYPCVRSQVWEPRHGVLRAGVSSFGFGGTNCHVILRAPEAGAPARRRPMPPPVYRRRYAWLDRKSGMDSRPPAVPRAVLLEFEEILAR